MRSGERRLITETSEMHRSAPVQAYISKEVSRPCKQWIHEVLACKREAERVKLRTLDFVLLPDVESVGKRLKADLRIADALTTPPTAHFLKRADSFDPERASDHLFESRRQGRTKRPSAPISIYNIQSAPDPQAPPQTAISQCQTHQAHQSNQTLQTHQSNQTHPSNPTHQPHQTFHWLAVATDTNLRTLRDLRGCHAQMLQSLYTRTCQRIQEETGVDQAQIMAYLHYPPSVYQLHVHFKHLAGPGMSHDTLRVHPLPTVLNNLRIDPEYYARSHLQMPVYMHTELYQALEQAKEKEKTKPQEEPTTTA